MYGIQCVWNTMYTIKWRQYITMNTLCIPNNVGIQYIRYHDNTYQWIRHYIYIYIYHVTYGIQCKGHNSDRIHQWTRHYVYHTMYTTIYTTVWLLIPYTPEYDSVSLVYLMYTLGSGGWSVSKASTLINQAVGRGASHRHEFFRKKKKYIIYEWRQK